MPAVLLLLLGLAAAAAAAQPDGPEFRLDGDGQTLWLAQVNGERSRLFRRALADSFDAGRSVNGRITALTAGQGAVYVVFADGSLYRYDESHARVEPALPGREQPAEMIAPPGALYALISAERAAQLPRAHPPSVAAPTADPPALAVVLFDGREWRALAECPPSIEPGTDRRAPRLALLDGELHLIAAPAGASDRLVHFRLDESATWKAVTSIDLPGLRGFWVFETGGVSVIACAIGDDEGEQLRLLRRSALSGEFWTPTACYFGPLPEGVTSLRTIRRAAAFNQNVALLVETADGEMLLHSAGLVAPPGDAARRVQELIARPMAEAEVTALVQHVTLLLLAALLVGFVLLRHRSVMQPVRLPAGLELAFILQRLGAALVDLSLLAVPSALILQIDPLAALSRLGGWGLGAEEAARLPETPLLAWWAISVGGYALLGAICELLWRRTPGKWLLGLRVLADTGQPPAVWQVLVRNAMRMIELLPQFWLLLALIVISRNRQRLGDVFALTVVARHIAPTR